MEAHEIWDDIKGKKVFFIAEIGKGFIQTKEEQSREEYLERAKELVKEAKKAGASAVKFQTHSYEDEQLPMRVIAPHFNGVDRFTWVKRNTEITGGSFWSELKKYCDEEEILFFSTPMSRGAAVLLSELNVELWKVGSGDILDFVMLDYIRNTKLPIIVSSGMSTLSELEKTINFLKEKSDKVAILHCVSKYPCSLGDLNVGTVEMFKNKFKIPIGFSDHSIGFVGVLQAVKCGATVIEKHFSISRDLWGSDHKVSMTPVEFADMVQAVNRGVDEVPTKKKIVGEVSEELRDGGSEFRPIFRKSLVAGRDIKKGEEVKMDMLYAMRPQSLMGGMKSERAMELIGKKVRRNLNKYEVITESVVVGLGKRKASSEPTKSNSPSPMSVPGTGY